MSDERRRATACETELSKSDWPRALSQRSGLFSPGIFRGLTRLGVGRAGVKACEILYFSFGRIISWLAMTQDTLRVVNNDNKANRRSEPPSGGTLGPRGGCVSPAQNDTRRQ